MKPAEISWPLYLRIGLGTRLARLGEKLQWDQLTYNRLVFEYVFHYNAIKNAARVADSIAEAFPEASTFLDVGCGSGAFAAEFLRRGYDITACERSKHGITLAQRQGLNCLPFDLSQEPAVDVVGPFDLVYCFEVAEHMPAALGQRLVKFISSLGSWVVFSVAQPGQGGIGHVNEQPIEYWVNAFAGFGHCFDEAQTARLRGKFRQSDVSDWFYRNTCVFRAGSGGTRQDATSKESFAGSASTNTSVEVDHDSQYFRTTRIHGD
jgi:SAM-dependent methyltransferase